MNSSDRLTERFQKSFKTRHVDGTTFVEAGRLASYLFKDSMRAESLIYLFADSYTDITGKQCPLKILLDDELVRGTEQILRLKIASWKAQMRLGTDFSAKQLAWQIWVPAFWALNVSGMVIDLEWELDIAVDAMRSTGISHLAINGKARIQFDLFRRLDLVNVRPAIQATSNGFLLVMYDTTRVVGVQSKNNNVAGFKRLMPESMEHGNLLPLHIQYIS